MEFLRWLYDRAGALSFSLDVSPTIFLFLCPLYSLGTGTCSATTQAAIPGRLSFLSEYDAADMLVVG